MHFKSRNILLILPGLLVLFVFSCSRADNSLRAGTGRLDITPTEPLPMWGYAFRHDTLSQGTLDPLYANALVLQLAGKKIALVSLDLGRPPTEKMLVSIRTRIKDQAGIEFSFISASHTHHGPVLELSNKEGEGQGRFDAAFRYYQKLEDTIVQAILVADKGLKQAKMATGTVKLENFNFNRQTEFKPEPVDRDLSIMRFDDLSGKPMAIVINFAAHPTLVSESELKFSADYPGVVKELVEKETGAVALFMQGAAGDLSAYGDDYKKFGSNLAREVVKLASTLETKEVTDPNLQVRSAKFAFPSRLNLNRPESRKNLAKEFFPELIANYADEYATGIHPDLTVAVLNREIALVGVSGEFFCNHALRLKERMHGKQVFFFGYCNGYHQYFPTIEAVAEGGYGTDNISAPAAEGAGEQVMNSALIWIYEMMPNAQNGIHPGDRKIGD